MTCIESMNWLLFWWCHDAIALFFFALSSLSFRRSFRKISFSLKWEISIRVLITFHEVWPVSSVGSHNWYFQISIYPGVGRCGPAPHTLTPFKTNITDFLTLLFICWLIFVSVCFISFCLFISSGVICLPRHLAFIPWFIPGGGGVLDISRGGEVRPGTSYPESCDNKLCGFLVV